MGAIVEQGGGSLEMYDSTILNNQGTYQFAAANNILLGNAAPSFVNTGTVKMTAGSGTASIEVPFDNQGTVEATAGGTLDVSTSALTNFSAGTLTGGTWQASGGGILRLQNGGSPADITTNAATIILDGATSHIYDNGSGTASALAGLATNAVAGSLTVQNGYNFTTVGALSNSGTLTVGAGSKLAVSGNYTQASGGTLAIAINGTTAVTNYGHLAVSGTANLAGTLSANTVGGFPSAAGDTYQPLTASSIGGTFATVTATLGDGDTVSTAYSPSAVTLTDLPTVT